MIAAARRRPSTSALALGLTLAAVSGTLAAAPQASLADAPALPGSAFVARMVCPPLDPFAAEEAQRLDDRLQGRCRVPPLGRSAPMVEGSGQRSTLRLEQQFGVQHGTLAARLQVQMKAIIDGAVGAAALTPQSEVAAGLWWQPMRSFAVLLRHGERRELQGTARRTELTGAWRLTADALLTSGWTGWQHTPEHRIGLRWRLLPGMVLDLAIPAEGIEHRPLRLQLNWSGFAH
ncbi:MAG: hypothetical protein ABI696_13920 [Rubrivivax sp.]